MVDLYCSQASAGTCSRDGLVPAWARREIESCRCAARGVDEDDDGSEGRGGLGGGDIGPGVDAAAGAGVGVDA